MPRLFAALSISLVLNTIAFGQTNEGIDSRPQCIDGRKKVCGSTIRNLLAKPRMAFRISRDQFQEIPAPGNLAPRYPYDSLRLYYYDRPYNVDQTSLQPNATGTKPGLPYSNQLFHNEFSKFDATVVEKMLGDASVPNLSVGKKSILHDKCLEYVDWREYRRDRLKWLAEKKEQSIEALPPAASRSVK